MSSGGVPEVMSFAICLATPALSSSGVMKRLRFTVAPDDEAWAVSCLDRSGMVFSKRSLPWVMTLRAVVRICSAER